MTEILICPYCKSDKIIKRGIRKLQSGEVQVCGCTTCKKRFTPSLLKESKKESAKIKELENINASLLIANRTLLDNNLILAEENARYQKSEKENKERIAVIESQRIACVRKCETTISEKNRILQEKETYIQNLHDTIWHLKNSFKCETYQFSETPKGFKFSFEFGRK